MNRHKSTTTICQNIFFLLCFCMLTLHTASAQLSSKSTDEPSLPEKYSHLEKGDTHSIQQMLQEGIPVDATDKGGRTLLMQKAFEGDTISLKYLIKAGADIDKRLRSGNIYEFYYTALDYAVVGKQKEAVDFLRRNGALWEEEQTKKLYSTVMKLGHVIDADMLDYILTKGARFGETEKLRLLVTYVTLLSHDHMQRKIMKICLRDTLDITPQKVEPYLNSWEKLDAEEVSGRIIKLQKEEMELRDLPRRKAQAQDSLRRLMAQGKEDTLHYTYYTYASGEIAVSPRIDTFRNRVGDDKEWAVFLISALVSFLLIARLVRKYLKEWKNLLYPVGGTWLVFGALFYLSFSTLYENSDDYLTRLHGEEYMAVADYKFKRIKVYHGRTGSRYEWVRDYSFTFVAKNGITTCLNQGLCTFSEYDYAEKGDKLSVRYLPQTHKLSIADASNTSDNLLAIGISSSFIMLLVALLMGKLGFLYKFWKKIQERRSRKSGRKSF